MESNPKPLPKGRNLTVKVLRVRRGLRQNELMARTGLCKTTMTHLESGRLAVASKTLSRIRRELAYESKEVEWLLLALSVFTGEPDLPASAAGLSPVVQSEISAEAARRIMADFAVIVENLIAKAQAKRHAEERNEAARLYRELAPLHLLKQEAMLDERAELHTWAMVERICEESRKAASEDPKRALVLANLALRCARGSGVPQALRARLEGFAWAFIANARRVASDLPASEEAFGLAWAAWRKAKRGGATIPLGTWQLYDLEASLRRAQRNLRHALVLLTKALKHAPDSAKGKLLLQKATVYIVMGQTAKTIAALQEAETWVTPDADPSLAFALRFNLVVNLDQMGRSEEAETLLPELRDLATALRSDIKLSRVVWIEARVQGSLGFRGEAIAGLDWVRRDFCRRQMAYDTALAALELAVFLLEDGELIRVKTLAQETLRVFRAQRIELEVMASLVVFFDAAAREVATVALGRTTLKELREAQPLQH